MDDDRATALRHTFGLAGQVAIVTGAASGIGRASAIALGRAGATVIVDHLPGQEAEAREVQAAIEALGSAALAIAADVTDEDQVASMFEQAVARFGTVHVLVANAGVQDGARLQDMTLEQWHRVLDVDLTGPFLCARAAAREFLRRGMQPSVSRALGKIVCMSSVHECIPWAFEANYAAAKGGVSSLMRTLAQELAPARIRVNAIAPGAIRTPINRAQRDDEAELEALLRLIPYGRIGEPDDIANAVLWLASDLSDYATGATLFVDGGMALYPAFRGAG